MRKLFFLGVIAAGLLGASNLHAQALTTVSFDSGNQLLYSNAAKTVLLTAGNVNTAGDGAMLQLGYYNQGTSANPFAGTFIALAGRTSLNTGFGAAGNISIGDAPADAGGDGTFALTLSFNPNSLTTGNSLPAAGQQLAIQFYNNTTLANSTLYNVVSDAAWVFKTPANPPSTVNISLDNAGLVWLGGAATAFYTSQPVVPEPSTYALAAVGLLVVGVTVRRRSVAA